MRLVFTHIPCTRCGETGRVGGGPCHNCGGARHVLTTHAVVALNAYRKLLASLTLPAHEIQAGHRIRLRPEKRHANRVLRVERDKHTTILTLHQTKEYLPAGAVVFRAPTNAELRTFAAAHPLGTTLVED